jgi:hypothetical protein
VAADDVDEDDDDFSTSIMTFCEKTGRTGLAKNKKAMAKKPASYQRRWVDIQSDTIDERCATK